MVNSSVVLCILGFPRSTSFACRIHVKLLPGVSQLAAEKVPSQKERIVFQTSFFRGENVNLHGCTSSTNSVHDALFVSQR